MSIIYDALKKVEETHKTKIVKEQKFKYKTYLSYGLALCLGLIIASISFNFFTFFYGNLYKSELDNMYPEESRKPEEKQNIAVPHPAPGELSKVSSPVPQDKEQLESSLVLNGIFFSENEGYALINNQIVKEGDTIRGATIKEVGLDKVKLEFEDSVFTLSSKR